MGPFHGELRYSASQAVVTKCVINANTNLEQNCNEHPSLDKMTFFSEYFYFFFNSLALVQLNAAIREWSLD